MNSRYIGRGGARLGAGAPSKWNNPKTIAIRVPQTFSNELLRIAKALDSGFLDIRDVEKLLETVQNLNNK